jgi:hypothetical protein
MTKNYFSRIGPVCWKICRLEFLEAKIDDVQADVRLRMGSMEANIATLRSITSPSSLDVLLELAMSLDNNFTIHRF